MGTRKQKRNRVMTLIFGLALIVSYLLLPLLIVSLIWGEETAQWTAALGFIPWTLFGLWLIQ